MNYYNEYDPKAAAWLRELIAQGHIPAGDVDTRSITEISPHELSGYTQQHFFAGIGGWAYALKLAGWPDDRPVRTGSCPCQPFSAAGKQLGTADSRHLWPVFRDLITFGEATVTFGEQVASAPGRLWLAGVRADLEGLGYAVGAADLCAAGVGAPHIRQRLFWMADPKGNGRGARSGHQGKQRSARSWLDRSGLDITDGRMADPASGLRGRGKQRLQQVGGCTHGAASGQELASHRLEHAASDGRQQRRTESGGRSTASGCGTVGMGDTNITGPQGRDERRHSADERTPWASSVVLPCTDGKARRIEPGSFPLAHGVSGRVGLLRGYGNAIVPQVAAEFVAAYLECE